jgi:hypothetical protein
LEDTTMPTLSLLLIPALALIALAGGGPLDASGQPVTGPAAPEAAACVEAPAPTPRREVEGCTEAPAPAELRAKVFHHLRYHSTFPATGPALAAGFRATAELTPAELAWVADRLPRGELPSAAATLSRLFPGTAAPTTLANR